MELVTQCVLRKWKQKTPSKIIILFKITPDMYCDEFPLIAALFIYLETLLQSNIISLTKDLSSHNIWDLKVQTRKISWKKSKLWYFSGAQNPERNTVWSGGERHWVFEFKRNNHTLNMKMSLVFLPVFLVHPMQFGGRRYFGWLRKIVHILLGYLCVCVLNKRNCGRRDSNWSCVRMRLH